MAEGLQIEAVETRGEQDPLPNPTRGCGHLKPSKAYIVGGGFSPGGVLPSWVELDPYLPYREIGTEGEFTRGYQYIDGLTLQLALEGRGRPGQTRFVPHYPDELHPDHLAEHDDDPEAAREAAHERAIKNHADAGVYANVDEIPRAESERHIDRIRHRGVEGGSHWGNIPAAEQTDLLMRAGESYYPEPDDYATEAIEHGLSKAISVTPTRDPPAIVPGITRCWILHPAACSGHGGGIIGFAYLSEVAFTTPEDGELPAYIEEAADAGKLAVRDIEPAEGGNEEGDAALGDFDGGEGE